MSKRIYVVPRSIVIEAYRSKKRSSAAVDRSRADHLVQKQNRGAQASGEVSPQTQHTQEENSQDINTQDAFLVTLLLLGISFMLNVALLIKITQLQQ